jgi:hypothetical protein
MATVNRLLSGVSSSVRVAPNGRVPTYTRPGTTLAGGAVLQSSAFTRAFAAGTLATLSSGAVLAGTGTLRSLVSGTLTVPSSGGNAGDINYRYVGPSSLGSGDGSSWANRAAWSTVTLQRGRTYYVMDGNYTSRTLSTAVSGTTPITIKKATIFDHGEDISGGWSDSMGDGQAAFAGTLNITTSNWVIDGQFRNENNWFDAAAYGFSIGSDTDQSQIVIKNYGNAPDNVTIKYVYCPGWSAFMPKTTQRIYAIDVDDGDGGSTSTGLVFSHMFVSNSNNIWFLRTTSGAIVEYSASDNVKSNGPNHGEIVNLYYSGNNCTVRYNKWRNCYTDTGGYTDNNGAYRHGGGTCLVAITAANGLLFYGNECVDFKVGDGALGYDGQSSSNNRVYNNTFVRGIGFNSGCRWGTGTNNVIQNNLWINCTTIDIQGQTISHNGFTGSTSIGSNVQSGISPTALFNDYAANDFTLKVATTAGTSLASPYNVDMLGNTRGADGVWDRGAYEKV